MPHILILEDEPSIAESLVFVLQAEGFNTHWETLASKALAHLSEQPVDLVIMDVGLPDMTGFEACKQLRKFSEVPVMFLTARGDELDRVVGLEIGADDYLTKPIKPRALLSRIKAMLKRELAEGTGTEKIVIEDLTINKQNYSIAVNNNSWVLPKKEFDLLMFFVTNPNKVYSRDEILSNVWGRGIHVTERTVDVHIRKIREKIGDDYIRTIKGVGYLFANA